MDQIVITCVGIVTTLIGAILLVIWHRIDSVSVKIERTSLHFMNELDTMKNIAHDHALSDERTFVNKLEYNDDIKQLRNDMTTRFQRLEDTITVSFRQIMGALIKEQ